MSPSQLYSRIMPWLPGCPEPTVDRALVDAAREFAEKTQISFVVEAPIALVNGQAKYYIYPDTDVEVDLIRSVHCGPRELRSVASPAALRDALPGWESLTSNEPTHYSCFEDPGEIRVYPTPADVQGQKLQIYATWAPSFESKSIPDEMGRRYFKDIVNGAKAELLMIPDRKWTNERLGVLARQDFEAGIVDARIMAIHGNAAGSITARPQRFGG